MLRTLSHRSIARRRTGFVMRRRNSQMFRVHGVQSQGTTDADTALVGNTHWWMDGIGWRRHGQSPATDGAYKR